MGGKGSADRRNDWLLNVAGILRVGGNRGNEEGEGQEVTGHWEGSGREVQIAPNNVRRKAAV